MARCPNRWLVRRASQGRKTGPRSAKTYVPGAREVPGQFPCPARARQGPGHRSALPPSGLCGSPRREAVSGARTPEVRPPLSPGASPGSVPPSRRGGENREPEGHPGRRVSEREAPSTGRSRRRVPARREGSKPELVSGFSPPPSFEKSSRGFVQLFPSRMYENRADGARSGERGQARRLGLGLARRQSPAPELRSSGPFTDRLANVARLL